MERATLPFSLSAHPAVLADKDMVYGGRRTAEPPSSQCRARLGARKPLPKRKRFRSDRQKVGLVLASVDFPRKILLSVNSNPYPLATTGLCGTRLQGFSAGTSKNLNKLTLTATRTACGRVFMRMLMLLLSPIYPPPPPTYRPIDIPFPPSRFLILESLGWGWGRREREEGLRRGACSMARSIHGVHVRP